MLGSGLCSGAIISRTRSSSAPSFWPVETLLVSVSSTSFSFSSARGESEAERDGRRSTSARRQPGMVGERALGRPAARAR